MSSMVGATPSSTRIGNSGYNLINAPGDPRRNKLFEDLLSSIQGGFGEGGDFLKRLAGGDESLFQQLEAPAMRRFHEEQGQIASRFSGMGMGARHGSGFKNTLGGHAADLSERLQSQRLGLQNQAVRDIFSMGQHLLGQDLNQQFVTQEQQPFWKQLLMSSLSGLFGAGGEIGGAMLGRP